MLERYTWRHDSILNYVHKTVNDSLTHDTKLCAGISYDYQGASTILTDVAFTLNVV